MPFIHFLFSLFSYHIIPYTSRLELAQSQPFRRDDQLTKEPKTGDKNTERKWLKKQSTKSANTRRRRLRVHGRF